MRAGKVAPSDLLQQEANLESTRLSMMQQESGFDTVYQTFLESLGFVSEFRV